MNNRIITTIYCAIMTIAAMAQTETPDSVKTQELDEVVIEAQMQRTNATSSTYTPTTRQKSSAQNAIDLLRQLAIPQININLVDNAVTTPSGQNVAVYINYIPASAEEIEGIMISSVMGINAQIIEAGESNPVWGVHAALDVNLPGKVHGNVIDDRMFRNGISFRLRIVAM